MHKLQNIMAFYLSYHVQQGLIMSSEHSTLLWGFWEAYVVEQFCNSSDVFAKLVTQTINTL